MLANSDKKQDLIKHSIGVMMMAMYCAEHLGVKDQELINVIGLSSFLHDVGKCNNYFQNITLELSDGDVITKESVKKYYPSFSGSDEDARHYPRHNEISWLYSIYHAPQQKGSVSVKFRDVGPQAVYWHHGTYFYDLLNQDRTEQSIINELNVFDKNEFESIFNEIDNIIKSVTFPFDIRKYIEQDVYDSTAEIPKLYEKDKGGNDITNAQRLLVRSCLIYADHIVSKFLTIEDLQDLIDNGAEKYFKVNSMDFDFDFQYSDKYNLNKNRFESQKDIVSKCEKTTLIKAPAGFGKTLIGIMWGMKQKGQIYWVCPRNTIAEGVYNSIESEIKRFGLEISAELFVASKREKCTNKKIAECKSDIVVTNIDNLLSPMVSHEATYRLFDVSVCNVVFDEFHEFITEEALFGAFVVYMKARNILCSNTKTLLLSATPSILNMFWDGSNDKTTVLPNNNEHYPAQHEFKYRFKFSDDFVKEPECGSLTMYSSIKNVQRYYKYNYDHIIHSRYSDVDRQIKMDRILKIFSKDGGDKNGTVISAPIIQAALDISFNKLYKTTESPESDVQTIGRINRWGEVEQTCEINILRLTFDKGENSSIRTRYNLNLSNEWADFISGITTDVTLNEIYKLYNEFNRAHYDKLSEFFRGKYDESIEKLSKFFPRQKTREQLDKIKDSKKFSGRTLRNSHSSYFWIVRQNGSSKWYNFTFGEDQRETKKALRANKRNLERSTITTVWKNIEAIGSGEYDYSELKQKLFGKKKKSIECVDDLLKFAKCSETPIPVWTYVYDSELGLIEKVIEK